MTGIAKPRRRYGKRIKDGETDDKKLYSLYRRSESPSQSKSATLAGASGGSNAGGTGGDFLPVPGGTMVGPIAFYPRLEVLANGEFSVSSTSDNFSSRVILTPQSGSTDKLVTITGASWAGQLLFIQGVATDTLTVIDAKSNQTNWVTSTVYALDDIIDHGGNAYVCKSAHTSSSADEPGVGASWEDKWFKGNIETLDGTDFSLVDDDIIIFMYDTTDAAWQQVTSGKQSMGGGGSSPLTTKGDIWGYSTADDRFPVGATDGHILTVDAASSFGYKWAAGGAADNLGNHTATQVLDLANFSISNYIGWTGDVGQASDVSVTGVTNNLPTGDTYIWRINGADQFEITETTLDLFSNTIVQYVGWTSGVGQTSDVGVAGVTHNLPTGDCYLFNINGLEEFEVCTNNINVKDNSLTQYVGWTAGVGQTSAVDTAGITWTLPSSDCYLFNINGLEEFEICTNNINVKDNSLTQYIGWTAGVGQTSAVGVTGITNTLPAADTYLWQINGADQFEILENQIDLHSHSFTNFVGWTAGVGQATVVDATGIALSLPLGDQWGVTIDGLAVAAITKSGWAFNAALSTDVFNMNSHKITNVTDPTLAQDAATKNYVDGEITGASSIYATRQLDNLSSPVLNTSIDFNSNAPTNFNGYTSQIVGNTLVNDAVGTEWTLPAADTYSWKIAGTQYFAVAAAGAGFNTPLSMNTQKITSVVDPTDPQDAATMAYVDAQVAGAGGPPFDDNQVLIQDEGDDTKTLTIDLSNQTSGDAHLISLGFTTASRTWTFPDATGTIALLGDIDKISEGDSSVEVIDAGSGVVNWTIDNVNAGQLTSSSWTVSKELITTAGATMNTTLNVIGVADFQAGIDMNSTKISNIGSATVTDLTEETSPAIGDFLFGVESGGAVRKFDVGDLLGGMGGVSFPIEPTVTDNGDTWTGTQTLNLSEGDGHVYKWILDQNLTFAATVTNVPADNTQRTFELEFVHDGVGGTFTVTLPTSPAFVDENGVTLASFDVALDARAILACRVNEGASGNIIVLQKNVAAVGGGNDNLGNHTATQVLDMAGFSISNYIGWTAAAGQAEAVSAAGITYSLPTGNAYQWDINGVPIASFTSVGLAMSGTAGSGNITLGENYMTIDDISTPANPGTGARRLFVDTATGELSVRTAGGTTVSLEDTGTGGDLWSDPVDADIIPDNDETRNIGSDDGVTPKLFSAVYASRFRFDQSTVFIGKNGATGDLELNFGSGDESKFIRGGVTEWFINTSKLDGSNNTLRCGLIEFSTSVNHNIQASAAGIQTNVPTSDTHNWQINTANEMILSASSLDIQGNDLVFDTNQEITTDAGGLTYKVPTSDTHEFQVNTNAIIALSSSQLLIADGIDISVGTTSGTKIGTSGTAKLGFYGTTPIIRPTGVAVSASGIHAALVSLGLITA